MALYSFRWKTGYPSVHCLEIEPIVHIAVILSNGIPLKKGRSQCTYECNSFSCTWKIQVIKLMNLWINLNLNIYLNKNDKK